MLTLLVCDVIGGFIAVASGVDTWGHAWGFDTESTVPLPVGIVQFLLACLAGRNVRPPVGRIAAVVLSAFCLISLVFGSVDGDLRSNIEADGWSSGRVVWGFVLLFVTGVVGVLAAAQARRLGRSR
jgi:type IV secretory pathway VirB2 component (pilin)